MMKGASETKAREKLIAAKERFAAEMSRIRSKITSIRRRADERRSEKGIDDIRKKLKKV
ncbi:MAG: hypothetical protein AAB692_05935 [Patescibacteria group bacterium]